MGVLDDIENKARELSIIKVENGYIVQPAFDPRRDPGRDVTINQNVFETFDAMVVYLRYSFGEKR